MNIVAGGIAANIYSAAESQPEKLAVICGDDTLTYKELLVLCRGFAHFLRIRGVVRGEKVLLVSSNSIEFVAILVAIADLGAILAPISPSLSVEAMSKAINSIEARHVIANTQIIDALRKHDGVDENIDNWIRLDKPEIDDAGSHYLGCDIDFQESDFSPISDGEESLAYILTMTSGSTGDPKPIILTQGSKIARAKALTDLYDVDGNDIILAATPMYHSLAQRLVLTPLLNSGTSVIMPKYSVQNWLDMIDQHGVSFTIIVSSQIVAITQFLEKLTLEDRSDTSSLRMMVSSSAALKLEDKQRALNVFSCEFHECYGASEIAIATSLKLSLEQEDLGSVGFAAPGVDIEILSEDGDICQIGEVGEIACRTPMLFGGYYKLPEKTAQSMQDGFFKTGDLGRMDERGALYFCGRAKDVIIVGGMNVYPSDIENVISQIPGVFACAAFSMENDSLGEVPAIAIVKDAQLPEVDVTARAVRRVSSQHLADFQCPQRIVFIDALPTNNMGKLMRRELEAKYGSKDWTPKA